MSIARAVSATLAAAVALGLGLGLTACGSATQPAAALHPAASSPAAAQPAAAQPDALAILRQTGATPDLGTTSGEHDAYRDLMATGSLPGGASASVYTSASQAAFSAEKSRAVGAYTGSDFTAGVVAIPAERTVIIVNSGSTGIWAKGAAPAQIAARVHGTVLLSTTPPAAAPPKTTPPKTAPPPTQPSKTPAPGQPALTSGVAVVTQYYQDVSDKNYPAAWAIGGSNLAAENGQTYDSWVAGYADTTASIGITSYGTWGNGTVWCYISAVQDSGAVNTYYGTYTVANGAIVSASIRQVG